MGAKSPWVRRWAALLFAVLMLLVSGLAGGFSYYPPGPTGNIGVSRPVISQRIVLGPGESIKSAFLFLDGNRVEPVWDRSGLVTYTPPVPLQEGLHKARLVVDVLPASAAYVYSPLIQDFTFTVVAGAVAQVPGPDPEDRRGLEWVNRYRAAAGLTALTYSAELGTASVGHAEYLLANPKQRDSDPHHQAPGTPLFFGADASDRAAFFGYTDGAGEVINFTDRAELAVDGWMDTPYHRIPLIHPGTVHMGYGMAAAGKEMVNVLMVGQTEGNTVTVAWPYPGQTNVPTSWDGYETPDPLRLYPEATRPIGYTITLTFGGNVESLSLQSHSLTGPEGRVAVYANHPGNDSHLKDSVALLPKAPLRPSTTYTVRLTGQVNLGTGPRAYDKTWSFTTAPEHPPETRSRVMYSTTAGLVSRFEVEGSGFVSGLQAYLGGLPVERLTIRSATKLTFEPPVGYRGSPADLLVVTPQGREAIWRGFVVSEDARFAPAASPFSPVTLIVQGAEPGAEALVHRGGAALVPEAALTYLGAQAERIPGTGRTYWTLGSRSGDYTLGRTAAAAGGRELTLALPVRAENGTTYVDVVFAGELAGMPVVRQQGNVVVGIQDITTHWARPQIARLLAAGIVSGTGDWQFRPQETLTRAAFVKMLVGARSVALRPGETGGFADTGSHWVASYGAIGAAVAAGLVEPAEYPGGRFEPDRPITREEIAVMVTRGLGLDAAAKARQLTLTGGAATIGGKSFADASLWQRPGYVAVAVEQGIITGYLEADGRYTFRADRQATRAEAAVMTFRAMEK